MGDNLNSIATMRGLLLDGHRGSEFMDALMRLSPADRVAVRAMLLKPDSELARALIFKINAKPRIKPAS